MNGQISCMCVMCCKTGFLVNRLDDNSFLVNQSNSKKKKKRHLVSKCICNNFSWFSMITYTGPLYMHKI